MYDLLIHFGCEESADVFKKKSVWWYYFW
jgi:hypothetical protein